MGSIGQRLGARFVALGQISHLMSTGATDALLMALATISGILVARLLGPAGRGELAIAVLWPSVLAAVGNLGLREAFTFELAKAPSLRARLTGLAVLLALGQSILLVGLGYVLIPWLTRDQSHEVTRSALLFLWFIPANLLASYTLGLLQGDLAISIFNMIRLSVSIVYLAAVLVLWALGTVTVWNVTLGLLLANYITATFGVVAVLVKYSATWRMDRALTWRLFSYGIRNHAGSISSLLNQRLDQMLMAVLLVPEQLGWYSAAVNISGLARLGSGAFGTLVFPKVAATDPTEQRRVTKLYSRLNVTITAASGLVLMATLPHPGAAVVRLSISAKHSTRGNPDHSSSVCGDRPGVGRQLARSGAPTGAGEGRADLAGRHGAWAGTDAKAMGDYRCVRHFALCLPRGFSLYVHPNSSIALAEPAGCALAGFADDDQIEHLTIQVDRPSLFR